MTVLTRTQTTESCQCSVDYGITRAYVIVLHEYTHALSMLFLPGSRNTEMWVTAAFRAGDSWGSCCVHGRRDTKRRPPSTCRGLQKNTTRAPDNGSKLNTPAKVYLRPSLYIIILGCSGPMITSTRHKRGSQVFALLLLFSVGQVFFLGCCGGAPRSKTVVSFSNGSEV